MAFRIVTGSKSKAQLSYRRSFRSKESAKRKAKDLRDIFGYNLRVVKK